jgi:ubiquinone/menaquinone biosynthesis C-methylase UbiE
VSKPSEKRKEILEHYGVVAEQSGCCNPTTLLYLQSELQGLPQQACNASRGCGNPLAQAELLPGEKVLDLGCGGGIDVLLAAHQVGSRGHVYGLDMTPQMLELAEQNAQEAGAENVSFLLGYIEDIPMPNASVDVVTSNCVINLSDDKAAVLREAYRVLRPGGRFIVADIVLSSDAVPLAMAVAAAPILGCVNGVLTEAEYRGLMRQSGFSAVDIEVYKRYPYERLAEKAIQRGQEELLTLLDRDIIGDSLAAAFITGFKPCN